MTRRPDLETRLDDLNVAWEYRTVDLDHIDVDESTAHQYRLQVVDQAAVDRYAADMARGDDFPAVLARQIRGKLVLLGGMHRTRAAHQAGRTSIDAYVVTCTPKDARRLSFDDNRTHGLPLSVAERGELAARLVELDGYSQTTAADIVGVSKVAVQTACAARSARHRAAEAGIDLTDVAPSALARLDALTGDLFTDACRVVAATRMGQADVTKLVTRLSRAASLADAYDELDVISAGYVRGEPGHGNRRHARGRMLNAALELLDCDPAEIADGVLPGDVQALSDLCKRAARHLMTVDKTIRGDQ